MDGLYSDSAAFEGFLERFVDMGFETQSQCVDIMHFYRSMAYCTSEIYMGRDSHLRREAIVGRQQPFPQA